MMPKDLYYAIHSAFLKYERISYLEPDLSSISYVKTAQNCTNNWKLSAKFVKSMYYGKDTVIGLSHKKYEKNIHWLTCGNALVYCHHPASSVPSNLGPH